MQRNRPAILARLGLAALLLLGTNLQSKAENTAAADTLTAELQTLGGGAATIFVGQITSIQRKQSAVEVTFRVEQPVCGAVGATFVLREWSGLWAPGHLRYTVGQRVLAFVHGSGSGGFSSPVHGAEGLVPVVVQGAQAPELLDIRRIAASVVRPSGTPLPTETEGAVQLSDALAVIYQASSSAPEIVRAPLPLHGRMPGDRLPPPSLHLPSEALPNRPSLFTPAFTKVADAQR